MTFPKAAPDGLLAATMLAFLGTAGLFYVNIMAAIVDGLVDGMGLTNTQAGNIGAANIYGAAAGALLAVFLVRHVHWRILSASCLVLLIALDLLSIPIRSAEGLLLIRLAHGIVGGLSVGTGLAVIARTAIPDRGFGVLLFVQFGLGGLGVMMLPNLVPIYGTAPLFIALALFSVATLLMVPFLPDYPPKKTVRTEVGTDRINWAPYILTMLSIFLFQAANMGLLAYILRIGTDFGLTKGYVSSALGIATWVALAGPFLVIWLGIRFGRFRLLAAAMVLTLAGNALFHISGNPAVYLLANCATGITWGFVIPYLFGVSSAFDTEGRGAAFAGVISKLGLATGPFVGAQILAGGGDFHSLINIAVVMMAVSMVLMLLSAFWVDRGRKNATS